MGCLDGCVQRKDIGLKCNVLDGLDDGADLVGGPVDIFRGFGKLLHLRIRFIRKSRRLIHQLAGIAAADCAVLDLGGNGSYI